MNIINVELIETNDKQLICTSGNFVMGFKGDNNTTRIKFNVPSKFTQENAIVVLISPDKQHQYSVPLNDFSFVVTSTISKEVGDWNLVLMLMGNENDETLPVCVSDSIIGTIKDSGINTDDFETLPTDANMEVLVNTLLSLQRQLEETLLNENIETVQQIQEDLEDIKKQMNQLFLIDWSTTESLANVGDDLQEIKTITNENTTIIKGLESDHVAILDTLDSVDDKIGDGGEKSLFGEITSTNSNVLGLVEYVRNVILNKLNSIENDIPDTTNIEVGVEEIKTLIGTINNELSNL